MLFLLLVFGASREGACIVRELSAAVCSLDEAVGLVAGAERKGTYEWIKPQKCALKRVSNNRMRQPRNFSKCNGVGVGGA